MKNYWNPLKLNSPMDWEKAELVAIPGFDGYYVSRFNDVFSFQTRKGRRVSTYASRQGKYIFDCVQLYDNDGVKRQRSVKSLLSKTLGPIEYDKRRKAGLNRAAILMRENDALEEHHKRQKEENQRVIDENQRALRVEMAEDMERRRLEEIKKEQSNNEIFAIMEEKNIGLMDAAKEYRLRQTLGELF